MEMRINPDISSDLSQNKARLKWWKNGFKSKGDEAERNKKVKLYLQVLCLNKHFDFWTSKYFFMVVRIASDFSFFCSTGELGWLQLHNISHPVLSTH